MLSRYNVAVMEEDFDFYAQQAAGNVGFSATPETGEVFYLNHPRHETNNAGWHAMKTAIEDAGGKVVVAEYKNTGEATRSAMFTRDAGVLLHLNGHKAFLHPEPTGDLMRERTRDEVAFMSRHDALSDIEKIPVNGDLEGGNLVYSPHHRTLFVGVSEHEFGNRLQRLYAKRHTDDMEARNASAILDKMDNAVPLTEEEQAWFDGEQAYFAEIREQTMANLQSAIDGFNQTLLDKGAIASLEEGIKLQPVQIKREMAFPNEDLPKSMRGAYFFHLDNLMNVLPSGQVVLCEQALERGSLRDVKQSLGDTPIYPIDSSAARLGSANFITVGDKVVVSALPFFKTDPNKPELEEWFKQQGYSEVITAETKGGRIADWRFASGGFVRCATQKLTEDMGHPAPKQEQSIQIG